MSETPLQRRLLLRSPSEFPTLRLFRRNVGVATYHTHDGPDRHVAFGIKGQCDLYAIVDGGLHIELECKAPDGRLKPAQRDWRDWCLAHRVPWICLTEGKDETEEQTIDRWIAEIRALIDIRVDG